MDGDRDDMRNGEWDLSSHAGNSFGPSALTGHHHQPVTDHQRSAIMSQATSQVDQAAENREVARLILTLLGTEEQFDYLADDVVMEFPYGPSLGQPDHFKGKPAVMAYTRALTERIGRIKMRDMAFSSVDGDPDTVFIEYSGDVNTPGGHTYVQTYVNKMRFREGKLVQMREVWDTKLILDAASGAFDVAPVG
jgi:uncharacterized protein